jgi:hypothetical protein
MAAISRSVTALLLFCPLALSAADAAGIPLPFIGKITPRASREIASSDWSVGCEVLDRDFASYAAYKSYLGPLGAKGVRLQAGWAKCEKQPGTYDWQWLDEVIDDTKAQGTQPWVQLSYGNPAYPGGGGRNIGDAGPTSPEALAAWDRWARALVRRYRDRVHEWEIWNESDIFKKMTLGQYVDLFIRSATILRAEQPAARIYALSLAHRADYARDFLKAVEAQGQLGLVDAITFHSYPHNPDDLKTYEDLRAVVATFPRKIELRQGETGAPSGKTTGALGGYEWNETKQAKWDLRRMLAHHGQGVPMNVFTLSDFYYPKGLNAKGLVRINPDLSVVGRKPAYFAVQTVFAIFDHGVVVVPGKTVAASTAEKIAGYVYRHQGSRRHLASVWFGGAPPTLTDELRTVDVTLPFADLADPVLVDLKSGRVFEIPAGTWSRRGDTCELRGVPLYDSPVVIASRGDLRFK